MMCTTTYYHVFGQRANHSREGHLIRTNAGLRRSTAYLTRLVQYLGVEECHHTCELNSHHFTL
ncbi:hypothetical protein MPTK1_6g10810 [Marchantia polymorpha subsp. ruderalis]|uniref:Uncharacterized protein n=2 Tax=Marchantia polymorpha TaxID=3197 RepID=A0AAF6BQQ3_MARPO|nr:hypothetical protein MARPO_0016s0120 [Marchantia polymorpha]BBN14337.1 hypothetical protein Mp_6g10810 [Marchantia polymorpha subsp. ruderalis]|eukprot:PTQ45070.1 hypothetical protein MARPO_0016s0120 [Marchantia polymorpha]